MGSPLALLLSVIAALALLGGAHLPGWHRWRDQLSDHRLALLIGFSAGLMLATALHDLIPEALAANRALAMGAAGAGFLILYAAERITHFHACRHRVCAPGEGLVPQTHHHGHDHVDTMALIGMSIHNLGDGLSLGVAFAVPSRVVALTVVLAILLHQSAAGISLGAIMMKARRQRPRIFWSTAVSASCIVWGTLLYTLVFSTIARGGNALTTQHAQGMLLGLAGGTFLYVAACDLLPVAHAEDEGVAITGMTLAGYLFAVALHAVA